jgi:hypothetical protein
MMNPTLAGRGRNPNPSGGRAHVGVVSRVPIGNVDRGGQPATTPLAGSSSSSSTSSSNQHAAATNMQQQPTCSSNQHAATSSTQQHPAAAVATTRSFSSSSSTASTGLPTWEARGRAGRRTGGRMEIRLAE